MHPLVTLSESYGIPVGTVNWWDAQLERPPRRTSSATRTRPPRALVRRWQNWHLYDPLRGGTLPSAWAGTPHAGWRITGSVVI